LLGEKVSIVTTDAELKTVWKYENDRLSIFVIPRRRGISCCLDLFRKEVLSMASIINEIDADVVHAHWTYEFAAAAIRSRLPHVVTAHDAPWKAFAYMRDPLRFARLLLSYNVVRRARKMVCVSPYIASHLRRFYGLDNSEVIPNGFVLPDGVAVRSLRRCCGGNRRILAVAGWSRLKNVKALLCAFRLLRMEDPRYELKIVGGGFAEREGGYQFVKRNGLGAGITFLGELLHKELIETMCKEADILVHPSLEESFCMVLLEAMSCGVPVVGGVRSGAVPWLLGEGEFGTLVDVRSPTAIAETIRACFMNYELIAKKAEKARRMVETEYSLRRCVERYCEVYRMTCASC